MYLSDRVISCGVRHIRFWTLLGNTLQYDEGHFGKSEPHTLLCIGSFGHSNTKESGSSTTNDNLCFTGAINGDLIIWKKNKIDRIIPGAHNVEINLFLL